MNILAYCALFASSVLLFDKGAVSVGLAGGAIAVAALVLAIIHNANRP